ncbi:MAG TPA: 2-dehydropantoate 2-reductase [Candidatus Limnocylindrales bacterium]|nr:2-dehydropantoate 2-reductase [Candidatus Limnocylindrales bacterium]
MTQGRLSLAVLGPGGVGGFLAAVMAREGSSVLVLAGPETSRAIAQHGLQLESKRFGNFQVSVQTSERLTKPVDACFVTVKATQLSDALGRLPVGALGDGLVIPFLNGLEHIDTLRSVYEPTIVVAATIRIETTRIGPGVIRHTSPFAAVELAASVDNRERVDRIAEHMTAAGLDARVRDDELATLWDKFALLAPMALLTTHEYANVGTIRTKRRTDAIALIHEIAAVAEADGVNIDPEAVLRLMDSVPESMESSMQRDQTAGRPLELDALGGALLRRAHKARVAVPVTRRIVDELESRSGRSVSPRAPGPASS